MTNNIICAKIEIQGTRPLWQHKFGPDAIPLEKQEKTGVAGHDPEEWRKTCSVSQDGQLFVDGSYAFGMLREAAKYTKSGKGSIQTKVGATLIVMNTQIYLDRWYPGFPNGQVFDAKSVDPCERNPDQPVYLDVRGVRNPTTKGRNIRYRLACSLGWKTEFRIQWDKTIVSRGEMEAVAIDAGKLVGLANGRTIGMGRFDVIGFEIADNA